MVKKLEQQHQVSEEEKDKIRKQREDIAADEIRLLEHHETPDPTEIHKPFRNYLMEYITPVLGEGLLNISEILPDDPVDFLVRNIYFLFSFFISVFFN